jgi:hypothetical protein
MGLLSWVPGRIVRPVRMHAELYRMEREIEFQCRRAEEAEVQALMA